MMAKYRQRDPEVCERDPKLDAAAERQVMRLPIPCIAEGVTRCPKCGSGSSRIKNVKRYDEFTPKTTIRYRDCIDCGLHFASRSVG
jgi:hypothetical protein